MQQPDPQPKQTPARRRQGRNGRPSAAHKMYASENDMATDNGLDPGFAPDDPRTPQKSASGSPAPATQPATHRTNKKNPKSRPKNVSTSPGPAKAGRRSPPQTAGPKPTSAFAGATFHASPAPSSLPIPSFFAKSRTDSSVPQDVGGVSQEPSPPASDAEIPTPAHPSPAPRVAREESPLDIFFRADRAEKEKARRASSANALATAAGPFSPPSQGGSPLEHNTFPKNRAARPPAFQRNSTIGISAAELDGTPGEPIGPAFSTPYQERIRAARSGEKHIPQRQHETADRSEDLKRFLFGGQLPPQQYTPQPTNVPARGNPPFGQLSNSPRAVPPQNVPHSGTSPPDTARTPNIAAMENSLRQILKLDGALPLGGSAVANRT